MQVTMAPEDGKALVIFTFATGNSLEEAAQNTIGQLKLTLRDSRKTTVNGLPAIITLSDQVSQDQATGQQTVTSVMTGFIDYNGAYYAFHGVSRDVDFATYSPSFEMVIGSFARLTDQARLNVQPVRLKVVRVTNTGTLSNIFRSLGIPQEKYEEFALLNNLELTTQIRAGTYIKIAS
jgi:predicted Zn-dependent protease